MYCWANALKKWHQQAVTAQLFKLLSQSAKKEFRGCWFCVASSVCSRNGKKGFIRFELRSNFTFISVKLRDIHQEVDRGLAAACDSIASHTQVLIYRQVGLQQGKLTTRLHWLCKADRYVICKTGQPRWIWVKQHPRWWKKASNPIW